MSGSPNTLTARRPCWFLCRTLHDSSSDKILPGRSSVSMGIVLL
ncbi:hypothetical protein ARZXY2_2048 [Arthrobacter sp. ZXY-2]|nr:hypothetical protein ARZXY2_2048 [Arthrobacter sp. ZXY-2]